MTTNFNTHIYSINTANTAISQFELKVAKREVKKHLTYLIELR